MTYSKLFVLLNVAFACTLAGCGSDDSGDDSGDDGSPGGSGGTTNTTGSSSGGAGGVGGSGGSSDGAGGSTDGGGSGGSTTGGSTTGGSTTGSTTGSGGGANPCSPTVGGGGSNDQCTDLGECIQEECESEYAECLGPNGANGNYSGGVCEDYMECASDCATGDDCDFTCVLGCLEDAEACQTCLDAANQCGEAACPEEYEECNASPSSTTSTTGSTTGGNEGACMDFEECCNGLEGDDQAGCLDQLEQVSAGGDDACAILLSVYQTGGQCPS